MAIEIDRLSQLLLKMAGENAPGREFSAAIADLARTGRFANLRQVLPPVVYDELWERYQRDPIRFIEEWENLAHEMQQGFIQHARQRLTSLTRFQQAGGRFTPAWKSIQRALDSRQNDLLRAAVAAEFLDLVEPAVARATHLRECVVDSASSDEADRYLDEATRCYFFALFTACAVMCRSVLEEAIKQKLPDELRKLIRSRYRNAPTLGNLLHEINNNLLATGIAAHFPRLANQVNDIGKKARPPGIAFRGRGARLPAKCPGGASDALAAVGFSRSPQSRAATQIAGSATLFVRF